jgi:hypothetical protein
MSVLVHRAKGDGEDSVVVVASRDAIHAAAELWCAQTEPPIRLVGTYFTTEQFLGEHPSVTKPGIDVVIFDPAGESTGVDFVALDGIIEIGHRVIVYSPLETSRATPQVSHGHRATSAKSALSFALASMVVTVFTYRD